MSEAICIFQALPEDFVQNEGLVTLDIGTPNCEL